MEANEFIVKLKANGSPQDLCGLVEVHKEYKAILSKLPAKDRGPFSLNVLCILCRNLDKVPTWRSIIDNKDLLILSIDCIRETRGLVGVGRVKTLACIYHIHRHVVRQNVSIPPELVLKVSYMAFESDTKDLVNEYAKTYWNIIADRISYIEKLKANVAIAKLLPKLVEDILKIIDIYNTVQFCLNVLTFLLKKLHLLYTDISSEELNRTFGEIFQKISTKSDLNAFKKLPNKDLLDLYVKLNDCLYVIAENASKNNFKDSVLDSVVRTFISMVGHSPDLFHCLQTFYLNSFCSILSAQPNVSYTETILNSMVTSFETTEKLGHKTAVYATYPFLNQLLRLYIEDTLKNASVQTQESCLKLIIYLMRKLKSSEQLLRCENCETKTGLHDALRLSFLVKKFIAISTSEELNIATVLPLYYALIKDQYVILSELGRMGCGNYLKYFRKLQTDIHNIAISLNNAKYYECSIKLFDVYLKQEMIHFKNEIELKNISRALYNKSICELDFKLFESALLDAFLSMIFAQKEGTSTDKYMSLVMDVKAKALKAVTSEEVEDDEEKNADYLQLISVLDACEKSVEKGLYGNLKPFMLNLKFSELLKHEFEMYVKLWPSIAPIAGVWRSLLDLSKGLQQPWHLVENSDAVLSTLYEIILETPTAVRTIHSVYYTQIVTELLEKFEKTHTESIDLKVVHATLLFLKAEYDLAEASVKYGWKVTEPNMDPDQVQAVRTMPQEYAAVRRAIQAVDMWTGIAKELDAAVKTTSLGHALRTCQVFVQQLLHVRRAAHALQLAHACCCVARRVRDVEAYMRNAGVILYHVDGNGDELNCMFAHAGECVAHLTSVGALETAVIFVCDAAIYFSRCGFLGKAAKLVQVAQCRILAAYEKHPEINLDLAVGRLLEAQTMVCRDSGPSTLSAVNGTQRHYLSTSNTVAKWSERRLRALTIKYHTVRASVRCVRACRALALWRRARGACAAALPAAAAHAHAALYAAITNAHSTDDAQTKIDNRLKHILGLQPSNESQPYCHKEIVNSIPCTPKQEVETMLENFVFKKTQTSPSIPCISVPAFKMPEFFSHDGKCRCYACAVPSTLILACLSAGLEASMYFRAKEFDIARNYFNGALTMIDLVDGRLKSMKFENFERHVADFARKEQETDFGSVRLEILIELTFFELSQNNFPIADNYIVTIHEIVQELGQIDQYLSNEIMNLMTASAQLRRICRNPRTTGLEVDFESLKLSPGKDGADPPCTPVRKPMKMPDLPSNVILKDEEIMKTRKVIKLNLDEGSADEKEPVKADRRPEFKIPVPVTCRPVLENVTPRPKCRPAILVTQPSEEKQSVATPIMTPRSKGDVKSGFFTPCGDTPEQFFTPMTSAKTYSKKSLRHGIVKNLEREFSTPSDKENGSDGASRLNLPSRTRSRVKEGASKTLKRSTSPGKLAKEPEAQTRSRRLRKPVKFSLDDDGDCKK